MFYQLLLLMLVNVLFGIAPLFVGDLAETSVFTLSFFRFFGAALVELAVVAGLIARLRRQLARQGVHRSYGRLLASATRNYYGSSNPYFFSRGSRLVYLIFVGFLLVNVSVPFYFLSFTLAGLVVSTIMVNAATLVIIAGVNWAKREERLDYLKIIDLVLLLAAIGTIAFSREDAGRVPLAWDAFAAIGVTIAAYSSFLYLLSRDNTQRVPLLETVRFTELPDRRVEQTGLLVRSLFKLVAIHLAGGLLLIPFSAVLAALSPDTPVGALAAQFLLEDLPAWPSWLARPSIVALMLACTALPYFLLVFTTASWPKDALRHDVWASVFTLLDPLVSLYIGFLVWQEAIRGDYVAFTTIFLVAAIVIRYFHGAANTRRFVFLVDLQQGAMAGFLEFLREFKEITRVHVVLGTHDLIVEVTVRSMPRLAEITKKINYFPGLESAWYSVAEPRLKKR